MQIIIKIIVFFYNSSSNRIFYEIDFFTNNQQHIFAFASGSHEG